MQTLLPWFAQDFLGSFSTTATAVEFNRSPYHNFPRGWTLYSNGVDEWREQLFKLTKPFRRRSVRLSPDVELWCNYFLETGADLGDIILRVGGRSTVEICQSLWRASNWRVILCFNQRSIYCYYKPLRTWSDSPPRAWTPRKPSTSYTRRIAVYQLTVLIYLRTKNTDCRGFVCARVFVSAASCRFGGLDQNIIKII